MGTWPALAHSRDCWLTQLMKTRAAWFLFWSGALEVGSTNWCEPEYDALVEEAEIARRKAAGTPPVPESRTPWEELYREKVGQLAEGAVLELAVKYRGTSGETPRHNH